MNKSEIQERIEKCESELATLKADLATCDCTDEIEQEKCWHAVSDVFGVITTRAKTKEGVENNLPEYRPAYMPECRQVEPEDALLAGCAYLQTRNQELLARELHKLGFRMKVNP